MFTVPIQIIHIKKEQEEINVTALRMLHGQNSQAVNSVPQFFNVVKTIYLHLPGIIPSISYGNL